MSYSLALIANRPDCEAMITLTNKEKADLEFRKTSLGRQLSSTSENSLEIETELASVNAEIAALTAVLASLPEGDTKRDTQRNLTKAEYKRFLLNDRKANYGVLAVLQKEYDIACADKSLEETGTLLGLLTDKLATL